MNFKIAEDLVLIRNFFDITREEIAKELDVEPITLNRIENCNNTYRYNLLDKIYSFTFDTGLNLNMQKEKLYKDDTKNGHMLLIHASKFGIEGDISASKGRPNNDFGIGFYCGDAYVNSVSFVCRFDNSSIYFIDFDPSNLKCIKFNVDLEWMLAVAYFRGKLDEFKSNPIIIDIVSKVNDADYIIAPIADNRMYKIIFNFIEGEITDEQCRHCLSATNLGMQYVFKTQKSINNLTILEKCFIPSIEKNYYIKEQSNIAMIGANKEKLARIKYRGQGKYIEEILK